MKGERAYPMLVFDNSIDDEHAVVITLTPGVAGKQGPVLVIVRGK